MLDFLLFCYVILGNLSSELFVSFRDIAGIIGSPTPSTTSSSARLRLQPPPRNQFLTARRTQEHQGRQGVHRQPRWSPILTYFDAEQLNETDINPEVEQSQSTTARRPRPPASTSSRATRHHLPPGQHPPPRQPARKFSQNYYFPSRTSATSEEALTTIRQRSWPR